MGEEGDCPELGEERVGRVSVVRAHAGNENVFVLLLTVQKVLKINIARRARGEAARLADDECT